MLAIHLHKLLVSALASVETRKRDYRPFAIVFCALSLRLAYSLFRHVAFADEGYYVWLAKNLFSGEGYTYYCNHPEIHFPPLFPVVLGLLHSVGVSWQAVTRVAYVLFGALLPVPIHALGKRMYGPRVGLLAGALAAVLPALTTGVLFAESLSEPLYLLCLFSGIHFAYCAWTDGRRSTHALAGLFFSLAYLTRPEGLVYFLATLAFLGVAALRKGWSGLWRRAPRLTGLIAAFLVVASPYVIYLHYQTGQWTLTTKSTTSYTTTRGLVTHDRPAFLRDTDGLDQSGEVIFYSKPKEESLLRLLAGPYRSRVISDVTLNMREARTQILHPWFFGRWMLLLAVAGLFGRAWSRKRLGVEIFQIWIALALLSVLLFFIKERLLYGILLPLTLWSALGIDYFLSWIGSSALPGPLGRPLGRRVLAGLFLCGMAVSCLTAGEAYFKVKTAERSHVWATVDWIRRNLPEDALILSNSSEVAFHSDRKWIPFPVAELSRVLEYGRKRGATHMIIQGEFMHGRPEQKLDLHDNARDREGLKLLAHVEDPGADTSFTAYQLTPVVGP